MDAPAGAGRVSLFAMPRWLVLILAGALLLNSFATALLATTLVLHLAGKLM